jgi:hypothetical protein
VLAAVGALGLLVLASASLLLVARQLDREVRAP